MSTFSVVLDACVLYPTLVRDAFMRLSLTDLFKARWADAIHDEWIRNVAINNQIDPQKLNRVRDLMDENVRDAKVEGFEYLIETLDLPDPDDRHVLAAAIHSKSDAIVTFNLKDFPVEYLASYEVELIHPDDFIVYQFEFNRGAVLESFKRQRSALKNPPYSQKGFIDLFYSRQLPQTASILQEYKHLI